MGSDIRVLLADDQELFVQSLKVVLETRAENITIVGLAHDGEQAISISKSEQPDVILMDVRMPKIDGVMATKEIVASGLPCRIIMLTTFDHDEYAKQALTYGAAGYLLKDMAPEELIHAVHVAHRGYFVVASSIANKVMRTSAVPGKTHVDPLSDFLLDKLSSKEKNIFSLLIRGYDNHQIAQELFLAEQTVKNLRERNIRQVRRSRSTPPYSDCQRTRDIVKRYHGTPGIVPKTVPASLVADITWVDS